MRFGRKKDDAETTAGHESDEAGTVDTPSAEAGESAAQGPFDEADVDLEGRDHIDLGSLLVTPAGPMEMRLNVDEDSGQVVAAILVHEEGALELRAFSASRGPGSWDELRPQIAEQTARMGGTATEQEGPFGTELLCLVPAQTPEGEPASQASRVVAHEGPRWLLRATLMGRPALEDRMDELWERTIRQTVVRRGREAMPPMTALALHLPPQARKVE